MVERAWFASPRAAPLAVRASLVVVAEVEAQWTAHVGQIRTAQAREALTMLREITDPYR